MKSATRVLHENRVEQDDRNEPIPAHRRLQGGYEPASVSQIDPSLPIIKIANEMFKKGSKGPHRLIF